MKANKLVEEKYGNYKRIEYQVDWVRLAELLGIPLNGSQSYDLDDVKDADFFDEPVYPLKGDESSADAPKGGTVRNDMSPMDDTPDSYAENSSFGGYSLTQENTQKPTSKIIPPYRRARNPRHPK